MPRQEKGSRQRGLPARLKLDQRDNATGSFPTKFRTSSDNRTGRYSVAFDDAKSISFNTDTVASTLVFPLVVNSGAAPFEELKQVEPDWFSGSYSDRISTRGYMRRGVSDVYIPARTGQEAAPWRDCNHPELDGMIATETRQQNRFYKTGSELGDVGPGFQQPLWSKTKIEIPITLGSDFSWGHRSGSGDDFLMVYYNHGTKTYNHVGSGIRIDQDLPYLPNYITKKAVGFGPTEDLMTVELSRMGGAVIDSFGFPFHSKYFVTEVAASRSILYPLSGVLSEPFLLEKVTVEFSATIEAVNYHGARSTAPAYGTFFILNQKGGMTFQAESPYYNTIVDNTDAGFKKLEDGVGIIPSTAANTLFLSPSSDTHTSGTMDIVTVLQFGTASSSDATTELARKRELMFTSPPTIVGGYTTGFCVMSGTCKSPNKATRLAAGMALPSDYYLGLIPEWWLRNNYGGRNGLPYASGRDWKQLFATEEHTIDTPTNIIAQKPWTNNPYLLMPTDKLIIGWQSPYIVDQAVTPWTSSYANKMTLHAGVYKVTLFGCHLTVGPNGDLVERHDTLNQLVSSNAIHEIIG